MCLYSHCWRPPREILKLIRDSVRLHRINISCAFDFHCWHSLWPNMHEIRRERANEILNRLRSTCIEQQIFRSSGIDASWNGQLSQAIVRDTNNFPFPLRFYEEDEQFPRTMLYIWIQCVALGLRPLDTTQTMKYRRFVYMLWSSCMYLYALLEPE